MTQTTNLSLGNEPTGVAFPSDPLYYLKIFSIFFRPSFPIKKKAPAPNNAVGIATYSRSSTGSPHIPSIKITSI